MTNYRIIFFGVQVWSHAETNNFLSKQYLLRIQYKNVLIDFNKTNQGEY